MPSRKESKGMELVALLCNTNTAETMIGYYPVNDKIISIRLNGNPVNAEIIQVYAPTSAAALEETEMFYEQLQGFADDIQGSDILVIMGDLNTKVGEGEVNSVVGKQGLCIRNEAGERMLEFGSTLEHHLTENMEINLSSFYN